MTHRSHQLVQRLRIGYIAALALFAAALLASGFVVQDALRQTVVDTQVTQATAGQRMLSQRIASRLRHPRRRGGISQGVGAHRPAVRGAGE